MEVLKKSSKGLTDEEKKALKEEKAAVAAKYPRSSIFFEIEGTDAQEYTTWKEHLDILEAYANIPETTVDITQEEIDEARKMFRENIDRNKLKPYQLAIIDKVMQPIKPRYFGRHNQDGFSRIVYIKTSSFPLIPQLTEGFEIDKLRLMMEAEQERTKSNVRASYQSGNKVGSVSNALQVWNDDGTFNEEAPKLLGKNNSLVLSRKGWGIQQDVPFKSESAKEDKIRVMTQLMKLMFGDGIMDTDGFFFEGKPMNGVQMQELYNKMFMELLDFKRDKFNEELGLTGYGEVPDTNKVYVAKKVQRLLRDEAEKRGYPLNDIIALGLDGNGNFNMPLWISANVNRFESLMNSVVDNALVKIKFPGYSYVAGTNEGFVKPKVIEEQDAALNYSEMIFTEHWNGTNLQMTFTEDGQLHKAQVFLPSKFKGADGKLIDMFSRGEDKEYIYVKEIKNKEGKTIRFELKKDAIDAELLSILTCRIPSSSLGSAATVEIAGFLPYAQGDLIIVPKEFTKQKGMDFDVDKEYSYHYHHVVDEKGRIRKIDNLYKEHSIEAHIVGLEELMGKYEKEMGLDKYNRKKLGELQDEVDALIDLGLAPFPETMKKIKNLEKYVKHPEDADKMREEYKSLKKTMKELESHKEKVLTNRIINLMQAVMENPSDEVQSKINKALNIEYEKAQSRQIAEITTTKNPYFTGLSETYQTEQFKGGVAGQMGTSAYSMDVVLHSSAQQIAKGGTPMRLKGGRTYRFGDVTSHNEFGKQMTVIEKGKDGDRSITEVNSGRQNASVDNGKEKVLNDVNLNNMTFEVDKMFNMLGLDKAGPVDEKTGLKKSLSLYFLPQPILIDYVKLMQNAKATMGEYITDRDKAVKKALIKKYYPEYEIAGEEEIDDQEAAEERRSDLLNITDLANELKKTPGNYDGRLQMAVLERFLMMKKDGMAVRKVQVAINTDSKGLNKSFFNVIERLKTLDSLPDSNTLENAQYLIGDYIPIETIDTSNNRVERLSEDSIQDYKDQGYVQLPIRRVVNGEMVVGGKYLIKPTTIQGKIGIQSLVTAYNLYNNFLPYDSVRFNMIFNQILPEIQSELAGENNTVELKQEVLREMKKFLALVDGNGIVYGEDIPDYRREIYIDSEDNVSLARYAMEIMNWREPHSVIDKYIKPNPLLNRFEFDDIHTDGKKPSLMKYSNATGESFNEQALHNAFYELLTVTKKLPRIGNKEYTVQQFAQAMITYSHLGNIVQEAIQFAKFMPPVYYNRVGYTTFMKELHSQIVTDTENENIFGLDMTGEEAGKLIIQYFQHFPSRVRAKLPNTLKALKEELVAGSYNPEFGQLTEVMGQMVPDFNLDRLYYFKLPDDNRYRNPKFITLYNSGLRGPKKQQLYVRSNDMYYRVQLLGTFGMDEYNPQKKIGESLIHDYVPATFPMNSGREEIPPLTEMADPFNVKTGNLTNIMNSMVKANLGAYSDVAKELMPFINPTTKIMVKPGDFRGGYIHERDEIHISPRAMSDNMDALAKTILHETIHSLTVNQIKPYITPRLEGGVMRYDVKAGAPAYVSRMVQLYNITLDTFGEERISELRKKLKERGGLSEQEKSMEYGAYDIYEFMSLMMTEPVFQAEMNKVPFKRTGETLRDRFFNIIKSMLSHLGVNFDPEGVTANAIDAIMELIETEATARQQKKSKYQRWAEQAISLPTDPSKDEIFKQNGGWVQFDDGTEPLNENGFMAFIEGSNLMDENNFPVLAITTNTPMGKAIKVDTNLTVKQLFDYIVGNDNSGESKHKKAVLEEYANRYLSADSADVFVNEMSELVTTPEKAKQFLAHYEESRVVNDHYKTYWEDGKDLMTKAKIEKDLKHIKYAMNKLGKASDEFSAQPNSFPDKPLRIKNQKCV